MNRAIGGLLMLTLVLWAGLALAADRKDKEKPGGTRDLVAEAFILPKNVHLRADQMDLFNKLRQKTEPLLREALDKVAAAKDKADKDIAARQVAKLRAEIHREIKAILDKPDPAALKRMQDSMRNAARQRPPQRPRRR